MLYSSSSHREHFPRPRDTSEFPVHQHSTHDNDGFSLSIFDISPRTSLLGFRIVRGNDSKDLQCRRNRLWHVRQSKSD